MAYRVIDISSLAPNHLEEYILKKSNNYMFKSFMRATEYANKLIYEYFEGHEEHADRLTFTRDEKEQCDASGQRFRQFINPKCAGEERIISILVLYPFKVVVPEDQKRRSGRAKKHVSYEEIPDYLESDEDDEVNIIAVHHPAQLEGKRHASAAVHPVKTAIPDIPLLNEFQAMVLDQDPEPPSDWDDL